MIRRPDNKYKSDSCVIVRHTGPRRGLGKNLNGKTGIKLNILDI